MSSIDVMCEAIEFIENHLKEEITIAEIADAVSYSLYHFCRVFNKLIHHSPYDYLIRRRLSEASRELIVSDKKIIDIALDHQFHNPETFSRAFKRMFRIQPNQFRKNSSIDRRFFMSRLTHAHIKHINKGKYLQPVLEEKDSFKVAGLMTLVKGDRDSLSQLWEIFFQEAQVIKNLVQPEQYYGITCYPKDWESKGYFYIAALEIESPERLNPTLVEKTIPALKYAKFIHKGRYEDLHLTLDYIYQTWLPKSSMSLACPLEIEYYGDDFKSSNTEESERLIYIPIK